MELVTARLSAHGYSTHIMTRTNTIHGNRALTERRMSVQEQIEFYQQQARMAAKGLITRRTEEYFLRQVEYFRTELAQTQD